MGKKPIKHLLNEKENITMILGFFGDDEDKSLETRICECMGNECACSLTGTDHASFYPRLRTTSDPEGNWKKINSEDSEEALQAEFGILNP